MQVRYIAVIAAVGAAAVLSGTFHMPTAGDRFTAGEHNFDADRRVEDPTARLSPTEAARPAARKSLLAGQYVPGDLQSDLLKILALRDGGAPPAELLRLAEAICAELLAAGSVAAAEALEFLESGDDLRLSGGVGR